MGWRGTLMVYKSDSQRRFFHTAAAKKAGITSKEVAEFDAASRGAKLPEKVVNRPAKPATTRKSSGPAKVARKSSQMGKVTPRGVGKG